ncbi:tail fiber assembly protein [Serratia plymuthica]|uniref:tail fiber assembly protein n=1 Tax=Serratia plymuthica TaxID=82996 RepID=UPI0018DA1112|nr:tail fiber assembly protein [Serratia plymuthica]QPS55300.1 tail fiber assembly protein [Serratia plymuthica]UNK27432.1 tail fiber assembly protein [Serratia plymuthica]CAI1974421.1 Caudovirales tail fibre assembly protein [Serratia plymuthica]
MKNIKNFTITEPETADQKSLAASHGVLFLKSESGDDWYECQKNFRNDTIKIMYDNNGIIRSITNKSNAEGHYDVSGFFPEKMSVAEIDQLPEGADIDGRWFFDGIQVKPREYSSAELQQQAMNKKQDLMKQATLQIATLSDAIELGIASDEEQRRLTDWKTYRVLLSRLDPGTAPDIDWPQPPQ